MSDEKTKQETPEQKVRLRAMRLITRGGEDMKETALEERFFAPGVVFDASESEARKLLKARNIWWVQMKGKDGATVWEPHQEPVAEKAGNAKLSSTEDRVRLYYEHTRKLAEQTAERIKADVARSQ